MRWARGALPGSPHERTGGGLRASGGKGGGAVLQWKPRANSSATRGRLLGAVLGLQTCQLAALGLSIPMPWYAWGWLLFGQILVGLGIGAMPASIPWWLAGLAAGALFGAPSAWGAHSLGMPWIPYGITTIALGTADGLFLAFAVKELFPETPARAVARAEPEEAPAGARSSPPGDPPAEGIHRRIFESMLALERLEAERERRGDRSYGAARESEMIWRELLDLELRNIDENADGIREAADDESG